MPQQALTRHVRDIIGDLSLKFHLHKQSSQLSKILEEILLLIQGQEVRSQVHVGRQLYPLLVFLQVIREVPKINNSSNNEKVLLTLLKMGDFLVSHAILRKVNQILINY